MNIAETLSSGLMNVIPHQVWTATPDGLLDYFNEQWYQYSHWSYEESKGQGWARAIHPDDLPELVATWTHSLQTLEPYRVNARILRNDNTYRWHVIHALAVKENGVVSRWVGTNTDVHDQKLLEEKLNAVAKELTLAHYEERQAKEKAFDLNAELLQTQKNLQKLNNDLEVRVMERTAALKTAENSFKEERDRLKRFFMQAPAGICILDGPDLVFELVNPGYQQLLPGKEVLGKTMLEALPELAEGPIPGILKKVYETGVTFEGKELHIPLYNELINETEDRWFNFIYQARKDAKGTIDGIMAFVIDVTKEFITRKELELLYQELATSNEELQSANEEVQTTIEELEETNQQLVTINNDLDNFIYTASHDLKAPISNIEGLVTALKEIMGQSVDIEDPTIMLLGYIETSVDRFKRTIEDLTDISRIQKENSSELNIIPVTEVLEEVLLDLAMMIRESKAQITSHVDNCSAVFSSKKNLRSIIYNLISNSIKYAHPERVPSIFVDCYEEEVFHVISVKDNGLGIDLSKKTKLFAMFGRLHNHVEGSGVGLYMVKKMVENAGGKIEVESEVGTGTTFKIFFKKDIKKVASI